MQTQTLDQPSPHSVAAQRADLVSAFPAERQSRASSLDTFSDRCCRCGEVLPSRRRRYCSDRCARLSHLARTRAWKRQFRKDNGRWPHPSGDYYSIEQRRQKVKEATARWRARKR